MSETLRVLLLAAAAFVVLSLLALVTGCTPREVDAWLAWHDVDPDAAIAFAEQLDDEQQTSQRTVWDELAWCESGERWDYNGSSGYDGGLQFLPSVWTAYGGGDFASHAWAASRAEQIVVAERILADVGWQAWPACSRKLGLR